MDNKTTKLEELKVRLEELKPLVSKGFKSDKELYAYKIQNKHLFEEYYNISEEIWKVTFESMTPEERTQKEEQFLLSKLKREETLGY